MMEVEPETTVEMDPETTVAVAVLEQETAATVWMSVSTSP